MSRRSRKKALELMPNRELEEVRIDDPEDGKPATRHRVVDSLGKLFRSGVISQEMFDIGRDFETNVIVSNLDRLRALPLDRELGTGGPGNFTDLQLMARRRVHKTMALLGGIGSPAGSCVWHVCGMQCSLREWALRQGWNGRPLDQQEARGILLAALGVLAAEGAR
jgi:hypothetical protein